MISNFSLSILDDSPNPRVIE